MRRILPAPLIAAALNPAAGDHGWRILGPGGGAVYFSRDGAEYWTPVKLPAGVNGPNALTVDPLNPRTLYACGFESSAWRSADRGQTWSKIAGYDFKWGHRVIPDPADARLIYITTFGGSVWHGPAVAQ